MLDEFVYHPEALAAVLVGEGGVAACVSSLYGGYHLETAPSEYLPEGSDDAPRLIVEDVEGPRRGARGHHHSSLALVEGLGEALGRFAHHAIDDAVEEQFECAGHVAPIAWSPDDESITLVDESEYALRIILGQHTLVARAALHAPHAGAQRELLHGLHLHGGTASLGLITDDTQHLRYDTPGPGTGVENENGHCCY